MGVYDTEYQRVTVYLKPEQIDCLNELTKRLVKKGEPKPSRSDLIRAFIDMQTGKGIWVGLKEELSDLKKGGD